MFTMLIAKLAAAAIIAPAAPAATAVYTVQPGDTLSGIAAVHHIAGGWPALYGANRRTVGGNPDLIFPGQRLTLTGRAGGPPRRDGDGDYDGDHNGRAPAPAAPAVSGGSGCGLSGTLSYSGLESLWRCAGGPAWAAPTAACIAEHESGGRQFATGAAGERGYWQISPVNGSLSTYSAFGNARAAVIMSHGGTNWSPWTTAPMCGV